MASSTNDPMPAGSARTASNSPPTTASALAMFVSRLFELSKPAVRKVIVVTTTCSCARRAPSSSAAIMELTRSSPGCLVRSEVSLSRKPRSVTIAATWRGVDPSAGASRVKKSSSAGRISSTSASLMPKRAPRMLAFSGAATSCTNSILDAVARRGREEAGMIANHRLEPCDRARSERLVHQSPRHRVAGGIGRPEGLADSLGRVIDEVATALARPGLPVGEGVEAVLESRQHPEVLGGRIVRRVVVSQLAVERVRILELWGRQQVVARSHRRIPKRLSGSPASSLFTAGLDRPLPVHVSAHDRALRPDPGQAVP